MKKLLLAVGIAALVLLASCDTGPSETEVTVAMTDFTNGVADALTATPTITSSSCTWVNSAKTVTITYNVDSSSNPTTGTYTFSSYKGATYTITGSLTATYSGSATKYTLVGDLNFTGGKVSKITYNVTYSGTSETGYITINGTKYDPATGKKQ